MKKTFVKIISMLLSAVLLTAVSGCGAEKKPEYISDGIFRNGITSAKDGTLLIEGTPIYAFGVNIYDVFTNKRQYDPNFDAEACFKALHDAGIPVARISVGPYHPATFAKYLYSKDEYFEALDAVIAAAEKWEIGLFASICWNSWVIPDFAGEHLSEMGNPDSKTVELAKQYYCDMVSRYKNSPAIWAWEFGNEYNLNADLGGVANGLSNLPGLESTLGEKRTVQDYYDSYMINRYYTVISEEIRKIDPDRLIVGGDSELSSRPASLRRENRWDTDTVDDIAESTLLYAPSPMEAVSSHMYQGGLASEKDYRDFQSILRDAITAAKKVKKGFYIGEYGPGDCWNQKTATLPMYQKCVDLIHEACIDQGVQIALAWNCTTDYNGTEESLGSEFGIWWFGETVRYNKMLKEQGKQDNIASYWSKAQKTLDYDSIKNKCSNYLMGTGNPGTALKVTDNKAFIVWNSSNSDTDGTVELIEDIFTDGSKVKVFRLTNNDKAAKTFVKNPEVKGLNKKGSYKLSFYLKTTGIEDGGVVAKVSSPNFFTSQPLKCDNDGQWQYFEFEIGAPTMDKNNYSVGLYLENTKGSAEIYGVRLFDNVKE